MSTRLGSWQPRTGLVSRLATGGRTLIGAASLSALLAAAVGLAAPGPAVAQSLRESPAPDPDGAYGDDLQPFEAEGPLVALISLGNQRLRLFDRNGLVATARVSTGRKGYDTPEGIFSIIERKVEHYSNLYDDAEMPFMQRLTWSGVALHQGVVPGYRASHGCIRLPNGFAERLFRTTRLGTRVVMISHDSSLVPIDHPRLPQPGDPPPGSAPPTAEVPSPSAGSDHSGVIDIAASGADASETPRPAVAASADTLPDKSGPTLAELRARRIVLDRQLAEATSAVNEARTPVRPLLVAQGRAEKALRQATALANRAERKANLLAEAVDDAAPGAARDAAIAAHIESLIDFLAAAARRDEAQEDAAQKAGVAKSAQNRVKALLDSRQQVFNQVRIVARRLSPVTIFVSREAGRVYVHQATHPVMELPIQIQDQDRPLGTHMFTAQQIADQPDAVQWVGLTLETPGGGSPAAGQGDSKKRRSGSTGGAGADPLASARAALDRFELPQAVLARIMPTLQPGSTVIVSDLGKSIENGPGTDIIVQTKGEAAAARSIAKFVGRQRSASRSASSSSLSQSIRRARTGDWGRW